MAASFPLPLADAAAVFDALYGVLPFSAGKDISARDREELGVPDEALAGRPALTYGETPLPTLAAALARIAEAHGGVREGATFLDVGSGTGKPVFAAALLHPWARCVGVEILPGLHAAALGVRAAWAGGLPYVQRGVKGALYRVPPRARATRIMLMCADACAEGGLESGGAGGEGESEEEDGAAEGEDDGAEAGGRGLPWSEVDVAYACSTCFDDATIARLAQRASGMRPGAFFILAGVDALPGGEWEAVAALEGAAMSWGSATVHIHRRRG
jgi:SAM-dependent methyltransferase